ncbi:MFS transporter [Kitasatospora viridis]|uniref:Putative MFS family arabinose efflux permease n=1 Tax=Kitasatospora viridis TaxID=281105 RepID=A0A561UCB6_9ACTN|nr:MFS transporter [Kitasatospora viridis]TWF96989.1 putative MFS family arabinose efflux permease [Kitasatospora viridis]
MTENEQQPTSQGPGAWVTFKESNPAVKAILAGVIVNRLGAFLTIFLVLYLVSKGYSTAEASLALGAYGAGGMVGVLIGGALATRLGARNSTVLSMASSAVLLATIVYVPSYPAIVAAVFLVSAVGLIYRPASAALLSELTPDSRQVMIFGIYRWGLNLGTMASPLLGYALFNLRHKSYTVLFWGEALVAVVYALIAWFLIPSKQQEAAAAAAVKAAGADPAADPEPGAAAQAAPAEAGGYRTVLRDRRYLFFLIGMLFNTIVYVQYTSTLPLDVAKEHVSVLWYTLAVALNGFMVIAFELPLTKFTQKWPLRLTVVVAWALVGVGEMFYGFPLGGAVILIGTFIWSCAEIMAGPAIFSYPAIAGPGHLKPIYISSFQFTFNLGTAIGPIIGGELFLGLGRMVWPTLGLMAAAACVLGLFAFPGAKKSAVGGSPEPEPVSSTV